MRGVCAVRLPPRLPLGFLFLALAEFFRISALELFFSSRLALAYTDFLQDFLKSSEPFSFSSFTPCSLAFFVSACYVLVYLYPFFVYVYYVFVLVYYLFIPLSLPYFLYIISCLSFCVARLFFCVVKAQKKRGTPSSFLSILLHSHG